MEQENPELVIEEWLKRAEEDMKSAKVKGEIGASKIINQFVKELQKHILVTKIILFGSYAKSQQSEWSDIDLAVISDDFRNVTYLDRLVMLGKFAWQAKATVIEALGFTEEEYAHASKLDFLSEIKKNGVVIYDASG